MSLALRRPNVPPVVWDRFTGTKTNREFYIRDVVDEDVEEIIVNMTHIFLRQEPTCLYLKAYDDVQCITEMREAWMSCFHQRLSIACFTKDNKLAGFLLLQKATPVEPRPVKIYNDKWQKILDIMAYVSKVNDPFKVFGIQAYLHDMGLLVLPDYRKDSVAERLLQSCQKICKQHNIPATLMMFTSFMSQALAVKVGFKVLTTVSYASLRILDDKKYGINRIDEHTESIQYMYKLTQ